MSLRHSVGVLFANTEMSLSATDCSACLSWLRMPSMLLNCRPLVVACPECLSEAIWLPPDLSASSFAALLFEAAASANERGSACCAVLLAGCTEPPSSADLCVLLDCCVLCVLQEGHVKGGRRQNPLCARFDKAPEIAEVCTGDITQCCFPKTRLCILPNTMIIDHR